MTSVWYTRKSNKLRILKNIQPQPTAPNHSVRGSRQPGRDNPAGHKIRAHWKKLPCFRHTVDRAPQRLFQIVFASAKRPSEDKLSAGKCITNSKWLNVFEFSISSNCLTRRQVLYCQILTDELLLPLLRRNRQTYAESSHFFPLSNRLGVLNQDRSYSTFNQ